MSIDFRCPGCDRLLRTDDADAGKLAKCPECGEVTTVPSGRPAAREDAGATSGGAAARVPLAETVETASTGANPYASPTMPARDPLAAAPAAPGRGPLDVGDVLSAAWRLYMDNVGICLAISVAVFVLSMVVGAVTTLLMAGGTAILVETMDDAGALLSILLIALLMLLLLAFGVWIAAGQAILWLKIARGRDDAAFGDLFSGGPFVLPLVGASLLFAAMVFAGTLACIVPGVILLLMFYFYLYVVIDRRAGALESLGASRRLTEGNRLNLFLLLMLVMGISLVAGMVPCGIGSVLVLPLIGLMWVVAYLRLSGQPTAENRLRPPAPVAAGPPPAAADDSFAPPPQ